LKLHESRARGSRVVLSVLGCHYNILKFSKNTLGLATYICL
jgi:hypothetical protein